MVSPTFVSDKTFIPVVINPISPAFNSLISVAFGVNTPTFSTIYSWLVDIILIFIFFEILPSITLTKITTPKYVSYQLSTNKHFKSPKLSPLGLGKVVIICSKISSIPSPVFPEHGIAFSVSIPITSSICFFVLSKSDAGRSTLFKTGTISWSISKAW